MAEPPEADVVGVAMVDDVDPPPALVLVVVPIVDAPGRHWE